MSEFIRTFSLSHKTKESLLTLAWRELTTSREEKLSLLRLSRGAKEEDEVNFRSSESRTLSLLNCYAECRRKSSSIKCLNLFERYNLHVILNLARADIASATGGQGAAAAYSLLFHKRAIFLRMTMKLRMATRARMASPNMNDGETDGSERSGKS